MTHALRSVLAATLLCSFVGVAGARADGPPQFEMEWSTIDAGGGLSYGGTFVLTGTVGQHDTNALAAVDLEAGSGFWFEQDAANCPADFNSDGFLDFTDFDFFVGQFEAGNPVADFNNDTFLDFTDFDDFVAAFESYC